MLCRTPGKRNDCNKKIWAILDIRCKDLLINVPHTYLVNPIHSFTGSKIRSTFQPFIQGSYNTFTQLSGLLERSVKTPALTFTFKIFLVRKRYRITAMYYLILVNNLKDCVIHWGKNFFASLEFDLSFWTIYNEAILPRE